MTGASIGGVADLTLGVLGRREIGAASLGEGLEGIAKHNFGTISESAGRRMGAMMQDAVYSFEGRATDMDLEQIQRNVLSFDDAGGFSNVTSAEEMEQVLEGVVENTRQFANKFKMKQEEAVQIMAQLQSSMVASTEDMGEFSSRMSHLGSVTGMGTAGITEFGMQGVDMFRGTGLPASQRFDMALNAREQAERLRFSDPVTRQLVADAGGPDGFAMRTMERSQRFLMSGQGQLNMASILGGASPGDSISSILNSTASYYGGDPRKLLELQNNADKLAGALGPGFAAGTAMSNAYMSLDQLGLTGPGGEVSEDLIISQMANLQGMSQDEARAFYAQAQDAIKQNPIHNERLDFLRARGDFIDKNRAGKFDRVTGAIGEFFGDLTTNTTAGRVATGIMGSIEDSVRDFGLDWRGEKYLDGISMNDAEREKFIEMSESGAFDSFSNTNDLNSKEIREARIKEGRKKIEELRGEFSSFRDMGRLFNLSGLNEDNLHLLAAGSGSIEETSDRIARIGQLGIGNILNEVVSLPDEVGEDIQKQADSVMKSDIKGPETVQAQLNSISRQAGFGDFMDATGEQKAGVFRRYSAIGTTSDEVEGLVRDIKSGDANTAFTADAQGMEEKSEELFKKFEDDLKDTLKTSDQEFRERFGGEEGSFRDIFRPEERFKVRSAIKKGELGSLDTEGFNDDQRNYLNILQNNSTDLTDTFLEARGFQTQATVRRRAAAKTRAAGIDTKEGAISANEAFAKNLTSSLTRGDVASEVVYDFESETDMNKFIKKQLEKSGFSEQDVGDMMDGIMNPETHEEFFANFREINSKINDSTFANKVASRTGNEILARDILKINGEDPMTQLAGLIRPEGLKVVVHEKGYAERFLGDWKD